MERAKLAHVAYALLQFDERKLSPERWRDALEVSLVAGTSVERYGRRWYMAKTETGRLESRWIVGRLAFEYVGEDPVVWDHDKHDVRTLDVLDGLSRVRVVPFVIDTDNRRVAFELRSQTVRPGTFQGNLQALLGAASGLPWRVVLEGVDQRPWFEWSAAVSRITKLWITVKPPNPHNPIPEIEEMFKMAKVASGTIFARGEDIQVEQSALLDGSIGIALDYGSVSATAVISDGQGHERLEHWKSEHEGEVMKSAVKRDDDGRVSEAQLIDLLRSRGAK
jgi:hypothetical protein